MPKKYLSDLHKQYMKWIKELDFYRDEIFTYKIRLEEIISQNTKIEVTAMVEQFQNKFIRQNEVIDILKHSIHEAEHKLVLNAKANNIATDHRKTDVDTKLEDQVTTFKAMFEELRTDFIRFAADVL